MYHAIGMNELQRQNDIGNNEFCLFLSEFLLLIVKVIVEIAPIQVVSHKIQLIILLKRVFKVRYLGMHQLTQQLLLIQDRIYASAIVNLAFVHHLDDHHLSQRQFFS